ncbi:DUF6193 family natural product biosynthesis protein [Streptomyces sp. NPDC005017]|uniref:DUF6193 family natural product biosynthesis protein n=1 Tax=Streptomyces sp. NPDC005017 TaxID=3364706 RepID=UPI0036C3104D
MPTPPDPAVLFPDVSARGSLASALRAVAEARLDTVPVTASDSEPLMYASVPSLLPYREPLQIGAWSYERRWSVRGEESHQGLALVEGRTEDLAQVARAARAWYDGAELPDIARAAPFVRLTGRFEVPDGDPARLTESEWRSMRQEAAELEQPWRGPYQTLIETAYAESALRALYPFTSHRVLRFSSGPRPHLSIVGPCLTANCDGTYGVGRGFITQDLGVFATAEEAVALAVSRLRSDPETPAPGA